MGVHTLVPMRIGQRTTTAVFAAGIPDFEARV